MSRLPSRAVQKMRNGCGIMPGTIPSVWRSKNRFPTGVSDTSGISAPTRKHPAAKTRLAGSETGESIFSISVCW